MNNFIKNPRLLFLVCAFWIGIGLINGYNLNFLANKFDYSISEYKAVFELSKETGDVKVRLEIEYSFGKTYRSDGFKFIDKDKFVSELNGVDAFGKPIVCGFNAGEISNIISWNFAPEANCKKRIAIEFKLSNELKTENDLHQNNFKLYENWVANFRVPVKNATYEIIFPENTIPANLKIYSYPIIYFINNANKWHLIIKQPELKKGLRLQFSNLIQSAINKEKKPLFSKLYFFEMFSSLVSVALFFLPPVIIYAVIQSARSKNRNFSSSSSGCAGGGCGGGGCGGGCGG